MKEWEKYSVGTPSKTPNFNEPDCSSLPTISHVCHVDNAINIIQDGKIKPTLVFDESKLNEHRILVAWLSPNYWNPGFRYGNICFKFDFEKLIEGKRYYWVEAIRQYSPHACRILITDQDRSDILKEYFPEKKSGPWWHDKENNKHYWNSDFCLEFMFEQEIDITHAKEINFVDHHPSYCSIHRYSPNQCKYIGKKSNYAAFILLAKILAADLNISRFSHCYCYEDEKGSKKLDPRWSSALSNLSTMLLQCKWSKDFGVEHRSEIAKPLARAFMNAVSVWRCDEACLIAEKFKSQDELRFAVWGIIKDLFNVGT